MKRRLDGSARPKVDSSPPWKASSFSSSLTTQLELMDYLGLEKKAKHIELKECSVSIQGAKCKICKRILKCITDLEKHVNKKHKYLRRKKDNKLVHLKLKIGNETFLDAKINQKYLVPPDHKSDKTEKSHKIDKSQRPLEVCPIQIHKEVPADISRDFIQKGCVSISSVIEDLKLMEKLSCKFNKGETSNSSPVKQREDCSGRASPALSHASMETIVYIDDIDDADFENIYEDVKSDTSKLKEEEDSDDGEIAILYDACRYKIQSAQKRTEQSRNAEAVGFVKSESVGRLGPMVSIPMEMQQMESQLTERQQMESQQAVSVPELPTKQELIDPKAMDYENGDFSDISDAETIFNDEIDLHNDFELQTEETYNLSIDEQMSAFTSSQADSDIYIIEDVEPTKVVEPSKVVRPIKVVEPSKVVKPIKVVEPSKVVKPIKVVEPIKAVELAEESEPTKDVELTKVIEHLEQDKPLDFSQTALMERLKVLYECLQRSNTAACKKDSPDNNNNGGVSTSDSNVLFDQKALKCLLGVLQQAYQVFSTAYNQKLKSSN